MGGGDRSQLGVGEAVAEVVAEDDVVAEPLALADGGDDAVVDRDDRGTRAAVDVDPGPGRGGADDPGRVVADLAALGRLGPGQRLADLDVVRVAGVGGDREVGALGEALVGPLSPNTKNGARGHQEALIATVVQFCMNAIQPTADSRQPTGVDT